MIVPNMPGGLGDLAGTGARSGPAMATGADIFTPTFRNSRRDQSS